RSEQGGRDRPLDGGRRDGHGQRFGPRLPRRGGSLEAAGAGVSSALLTATLVPSEMRANPVVTTRSCAFRPEVMTAWASSCCDTATGRTETESSSFTTYAKVPFGPRCTAAVGTTTTSCSVSIRRRTLTNWPGHSCRSALGNSALSFTVPVV